MVCLGTNGQKSATKEELKAFFVEKYKQIFTVLLTRFADLESSQKKGAYTSSAMPATLYLGTTLFTHEPVALSLFLVWIRSEVTTEAMWQDFNAKLATLVNWKATLTQWEEKVLQLTYILIENTYPKPMVPEPKKKKGNVAKESEDNKEKEPKATTGGGDDKKRQPRDARLTSMTWNQLKIQTMWDITLHILGNLCDIKDPPNFSTAISCVSQVVDLMCEAEDRLEITAKAPIPLQQIFLPWILKAVKATHKPLKEKVLELPANVVHKVFRALEFSLLGDEVMSAPLALPPLPTHSTHVERVGVVGGLH
ncbi:uncharacterized protein ACA1_372450 [Acanthamoeba castellanii str. Neff]|uniref:Proteasome activator Blm10 mid region domain-containing protein n=1 Tax=Acanthamoeba castellanii (strain ATCC 30010 / Neff) TaxID=1257118 RepID=L8GJA0_ACACF|nr:uncharacterized protein ACA1_372450 [Acanthamoeba castellanii str. Neff]ELR12266.1 hypothetical protein ACA1_372450 [Acanthamoeba castellanii str. Neff]